MLKKIKGRFQKIWERFSFEKGIDITNEVQVLYRKNIVIKNIIFLSNMVYTIMMFIITLGEASTSNIVFTVVLFPFTFLLNQTLKGFIYEDPNSLIKQQIAMYLTSFYMFLSSIIIYFKAKTGGGSFTEGGYILMYYSLVVISLYQNKPLMRTIYKWMFIIVTLLHFTLTYNIYAADYATDAMSFFTTFFTTPEFKDILIRTIILILFMVALYSNVQISQYMLEERKAETKKRMGVETDFSDVVLDLLDVVVDMQEAQSDDLHEMLVAKTSKQLALYMNMTDEEIKEIYDYAVINITNKNMLRIDDNVNYTEARSKAEIGAIVVKRIQLSRKCESICRAHIEAWDSDEFTKKMNEIQNSINSGIILLSDIYVTLRSSKSYKRPYQHDMAIKAIKTEFRKYVDETIVDRFMKYASEFAKIYDNN